MMCVDVARCDVRGRESIVSLNIGLHASENENDLATSAPLVQCVTFEAKYFGFSYEV